MLAIKWILFGFPNRINWFEVFQLVIQVGYAFDKNDLIPLISKVFGLVQNGKVNRNLLYYFDGDINFNFGSCSGSLFLWRKLK
jgi:hypothetical protein